MRLFQQLSENTTFPVCFNLLPHFAAAGQDNNTLIQQVKKAVADGRINAFLLSDRPVQMQDFSSLHLAEDILAAGGEPVVSLAMNLHDRNALLDKLQEYYQAGIRHFLFVSGDYPARTDNKQGHPVYDIDSVQMLMLLADINEMEDIVKGCVVSPFKSFESEQVWQYEKLRRKIRVGADFVVTQLGYDMRKFDELVRFCNLYKVNAPLVANIFITDLQTANLVQARSLPGVTIPGPLISAFNEEQHDQRGAITRAAKILAVLKGLGYQGALIGNHTPDFSKIRQVLDSAEEYYPDWQILPDQLDFSGSQSTFYYFQKTTDNGLNSSETGPVALKHFPSPTYSLSYFVDWLIYVPEGPLFKLTGRFCRFCSSRKIWYTFLWLLEYVAKRMLYGCNMCGDCTLYACGFLCYQSGCPKKMLNGPCGGSIDGYCEVFPGRKRCYWVKVYHHMKGVRQHVSFVAPPIPARDVTLDRTSSWINFFMGKDHRKMKLDDT